MSAPRAAEGGKRPLRVLIVEDREDDFVLLLHELDRASYAVSHERVETVESLRMALAAERDWDIVVSDYSLPSMTAHDVLRTLAVDRPGLPCIVVSGTISEEAAVDVLRAGARDFVVKERLARLLPAIERELHEAAERRRLRVAEATLQETRERMQFALETVGIGFWEWDLRSGQVIWSEVQERLHGLRPGAFGGDVGAFLACVHPDDSRDLLERTKHWPVASTHTRLEYRTRWPDGSVHWMLAIGRTVSDDQGAPVRAVGVGMDVTAQKQLEEQFRQAQRMESIGSLAGGVAHDFNNLLTIISGCCDLAAARVASDPDAAESLEGIRIAAASASALTRQLLTFSRRQIVMPRLLNLNEAVAGFGKILRRLVEENVHIALRLAPDLPRVRVDPGQVEQVLLNLVANARDAMPEGGTVAIETSGVELEDGDPGKPPAVPAGAYVLLAVSDTGAGLSAEARMHLFEPFYTTKAPGRGTGLGLSTVYGIVEQSDGHIVVESEPGAGARFSIYLPVASGPPAVTAEEESQSVTLTGSETILVVEDNGALRRLNERILQRYGYTVLVAANGAQAQQICTEYQHPIHLVLVDVVMPGDSGPVVGDWISRHRPGTKIIYMSGYTGGEIDQQGVLRPGSVFLQKPFGVTQLARVVREVLSSESASGA